MRKKKAAKKAAIKPKKKPRKTKSKDQLKTDVATIAEILSVVALDGDDTDESNAEIREAWRNRLIEIRNRWSRWITAESP